MNRTLLSSILFSVLLVLLHVGGFFFPGSLTWGVHFLGFMPPLYLFLFLIIAGGIIFIASRGLLENVLISLSSSMNKSPLKFLGISIVFFIGFAFLFKIQAPWWGDGFFIVKNFSEAFKGISPLYFRNEPLATYYYFTLTKALHSATYQSFLIHYWIADVITGIGFVITAFFLAQQLVEDNIHKLLTFGLLCSGTYMLLFFGYVETYSVVVFWLALYSLLAVLYLKGKIAFPWVSLCFFFQGVTHYLTGLLLPSLLYLAYREWKQRGMKNVVIGSGINAIGIFITLWLVDFNTDIITATQPHSHYLSLAKSSEPAEAYSRAYTLFSLYHLIDLLNLYVFVGATAIFLIIVSLKTSTSVLWKRPESLFFIIAILPVLFFTFVVKYDLSAAKDWDILAPFFVLLSALACTLYFQHSTKEGTRGAIIVIAMTILTSTVWFAFNTTTEPPVQRLHTLLDTRTVSPLGYYSGSFHLAMYYHQMKDDSGAVKVWKNFSAKYPNDKRGYTNLIENLKPTHNENYTKLKEVYEAWFKVDSLEPDMRQKYSNFCLEAGNFYFAKNQLEKAKEYFLCSISLTPLSSRPYNNAGSIYAIQESTLVAIPLFKRAIELDSTYGDAYYNLGVAYEDIGKKIEGKLYIQQAAALGNEAAKEELKDVK